MTKKAIPLPFNSGDDSGMSRKTVKSVFVDLQANTQNRAEVTKIPVKLAYGVWVEMRYPTKMEMEPAIPPDMRAVLAFKPMKITDTIPHKMRNVP